MGERVIFYICAQNSRDFTGFGFFIRSYRISGGFEPAVIFLIFRLNAFFPANVRSRSLNLRFLIFPIGDLRRGRLLFVISFPPLSLPLSGVSAGKVCFYG